MDSGLGLVVCPVLTSSPGCAPILGDFVRILEDKDDVGFYRAQHIGGSLDGDQGFVPSNFLREPTAAEMQGVSTEVPSPMPPPPSSSEPQKMAGAPESEITVLVAEHTYVPTEHKHEQDEDHANDELTLAPGKAFPVRLLHSCHLDCNPRVPSAWTTCAVDCQRGTLGEHTDIRYLDTTRH